MTESAAGDRLSPEDRAAVAAVPQRVVAAWADHDAAGFAQVFAADGTMILPGLFRKGPDAIGSFMADAFAGPFKGSRVTGTPVDVRFLSDTVALMITEGGIIAPGEQEVRADRAIRASWLVVKRDGRWALAAYQNSPRDADGGQRR